MFLDNPDKYLLYNSCLNSLALELYSLSKKLKKVLPCNKGVIPSKYCKNF